MRWHVTTDRRLWVLLASFGLIIFFIHSLSQRHVSLYAHDLGLDTTAMIVGGGIFAAMVLSGFRLGQLVLFGFVMIAHLILSNRINVYADSLPQAFTTALLRRISLLALTDLGLLFLLVVLVPLGGYLRNASESARRSLSLCRRIYGAVTILTGAAIVTVGVRFLLIGSADQHHVVLVHGSVQACAISVLLLLLTKAVLLPFLIHLSPAENE